MIQKHMRGCLIRKKYRPIILAARKKARELKEYNAIITV